MKNKIITAAIAFIIGVGAGFVLSGKKPVASEQATCHDYNVLRSFTDSNRVIAEGPRGDFLTRIKATPELIAIANKQRTVQFLSIENPMQYIREGYVLINTIPYNAMKESGYEEMMERGCHTRVFYGTAEDMIDGEMYAVELCER
ncbi:MAG: hypothetical protein FWG39_00955 [Alphaproteobacteria bacterium]|nr:hypothetical protein [Alphaproteobacteria bacterium]